jgi:hypothetical protein
MGNLETVRAILNRATCAEPFHDSHARFWNQAKEEFINCKVYDQGPVIRRGDGAGSPLIKALKGEKPFDGSSYPRMPQGCAPVPDAEIRVIERWIDQGCPD